MLKSYALRVSDAGLTIAALADACRASEGAPRQIESGKVKSPSLHLGLRIARILDVDPYWLAFGPSIASERGSRDWKHVTRPWRHLRDSTTRARRT